MSTPPDHKPSDLRSVADWMMRHSKPAGSVLGMDIRVTPFMPPERGIVRDGKGEATLILFKSDAEASDFVSERVQPD